MLYSGKALFDITNSIWQQMVGEQLTRLKVDSEAQLPKTEVCAWIRFDCERFAGVMVVVEPELLMHATASLFRCDQEEVGTEMAYDTLGEIANVISGHVRAQFDIAFGVDIPKVTVGTDITLDAFEACPKTEARMLSAERRVTVLLFMPY